MLREAADQVVIRIYREPKDDLELDRVYDAENQGQANVESPPGQTKVRYLEKYDLNLSVNLEYIFKLTLLNQFLLWNIKIF